MACEVELVEAMTRLSQVLVKLKKTMDDLDRDVNGLRKELSVLAVGVDELSDATGMAQDSLDTLVERMEAGTA